MQSFHLYIQSTAGCLDALQAREEAREASRWPVDVQCVLEDHSAIIFSFGARSFLFQAQHALLRRAQEVLAVPRHSGAGSFFLFCESHVSTHFTFATSATRDGETPSVDIAEDHGSK